MSARVAATWMIAALGVAGCAAPGTDAAGRAFYAGELERTDAQLLAALDDDPDGRALYLDELGVVALARRDLRGALARFTEASQIMGAMTGTGLQEIGAIVGSEASKIWRGDPHERAMNSYYLGIVNFLLGVHDNALAGFKNAIFVDSGQGEEAYDCDFAPALFLEGIAYEELGELAVAERSLADARRLVPDCAALAESNHGNVIVVVDVGRGPTKVSAGEHGEATRFFRHADAQAEVLVLSDGGAIGQTTKAGDVYFQATTRGGREFDSVLAGKAIFKTGAQLAGIGALAVADDLPRKQQAGALITGAALLLASCAVRAEADTRHWTTLPHEVQLFRGSLAPGTHDVEIRPSGGWRVAGPVIEPVLVPEHGTVLVYQRVLR